MNIEFTDDPHPRNTYWEMWGLPMFDLKDPAGVLHEINECRKVYGDRYIRVSAFDATPRWETRAAVLHRQPSGRGAGLRLERNEVNGRSIHYTVRSYARPARRHTPWPAGMAATDGGARRRSRWISPRAFDQQSGVGEVLAQLDRELVGLAPVKRAHPRNRGAAAGGQAAP